jgi:hypothetical protein
LNVKIIKGDGTETAKSSTVTKFDPQWLLPLLFLEEAQDMIHRDITSAAIGSIVLTSGRLIVTDLSILKEMWSSTTMKQFILDKVSAEEQKPAGNRHDRRSTAARPVKKEITEQEVALEILPLLPHSPQINIVTPDYAVWATVEPQYMAGTVADITLKHGGKVAGSWSMVAILDARPFEVHDNPEDHDYDDIMSGLDKARIGMFSDNVWKIATELAQPTRQALGRPIISYGVTPLIIFREIETLPRPVTEPSPVSPQS